MATSVRPLAGVGRSPLQRTALPSALRQGIRRQLGGMTLGRAQPPQLSGDLLGPDAGRLEHRAPPDQGDRSAAGRGRRAAAAGLEAGLGDPCAVTAIAEADLVTAADAPPAVAANP